MPSSKHLGRRTLLKGGLAVGAGLVIGFRIPQRAGRLTGLLAEAQGPGVFAPNQWLRIDRDGVVTIINSVPEMGQGAMTTMPMIVADELDADWQRVRVEQAPTDPKIYGNPITGQMSYGGSRGVRDHFGALRKAGAAARQMLREAAAQEWGVPLDEVTTEPGVVVHVPTGRRLLYGQLVDRAQTLPVPQNPPLKTKDQFRYIGKMQSRVDVPQKVNGQAVYGIDVRVPGLLVASIEKCPVVAGGKVKSFDATAARAIPGVKHVVQVTSGVAVVADNFWTALQGRKALKVQWNEGPLGQLTSAGIAKEHATAAGQPGLVARNDGDALATLAAGGKTFDAVYQVPYLEHACMEPMNATAHVTADACTVWAPTQNPGGARETAAKLTGLPVERVTVNVTFLGGGFGRRGQVDYVVDAVEVAKAIGGGPVKVLWAREDDMTHSFYRPNTHNVFRAALDSSGKPTAWFTRAVGAGLLRQRGGVPAGQVDGTSMAGLRDLPYDIPNVRIEWVDKDVGVPVGFWRSVGSSQNVFIVETFVDELAHLAGKDPFEYRRALLGKSPRHKGVLELAAAKFNWGAPLPAGRGAGIAVCFSYGSFTAHAAEVSVADDGAVRVHRIVCAIDCGIAVNPDQVKAQMEGGAIYALTAALYGQITLDAGRVQQTNFHTYPMVRIPEVPVTEVHILDSGEPPGGLGEPGVPTVAPAVCNAIFALTGKRIRRLPIARDELKRA
jgi:isoquinoline 1-oxidoreductase beta subunit